jgi:hypothetical protein
MPRERDKMEEEFRRVFGESSEEVVDRERQGDAGEEAERARARKSEIVPTDKEVEERKLDHAVFRSWCPHRVKGRAGSYGHVRKARGEGPAPTTGVDYMYTHSEHAKEEEKGMPIIAIKDSKTKTIMAKVGPSKRVENHTGEFAKKTSEQLGHRKVNFRSDATVSRRFWR